MVAIPVRFASMVQCVECFVIQPSSPVPRLRDPAETAISLFIIFPLLVDAVCAWLGDLAVLLQTLPPLV